MKLYIEKLEFELSDNFDGALCEALIILAEYVKDQDWKNEIVECDVPNGLTADERFNYAKSKMSDGQRCVMSYEFRKDGWDD